MEHRFQIKFVHVLVTVMVAVVFGVVFKLWDGVYGAAKVLFPQSGQLTYGMWFMAPVFAFLLVRKPGAALVASLTAASISALLSSTWGMQTVVYGFFQGLGAELVFAAFIYRRAGLGVAGLAGLAAALASFLIDLVYGYANYELWMLIYKYSLRGVSSFVIAGVFSYYLIKGLEKAGVTTLVQPASPSDYASLDD